LKEVQLGVGIDNHNPSGLVTCEAIFAKCLVRTQRSSLPRIASPGEADGSFGSKVKLFFICGPFTWNLEGWFNLFERVILRRPQLPWRSRDRRE
jgi:hypothetical protein